MDDNSNDCSSENIDYKALIDNLPFAYRGNSNSENTNSAQLRTETNDFKVNEVLSFEPSGEGEHLFLQIEKKDTNTEWVARQLQNTFNLTSKEMGYAGKKDRHSLSTQWFSLHLPGREVDLSLLNNDAFKVVASLRHNKKLRLGSVKKNQFEIILRNITQAIDQQTIQKIIDHGVPNYFGVQRFGFECSNLNRADLLLNQKIKIKNRNKRGLVISSSRSLLFNLILAERIKENTWNTALDGDCLTLNGSQSFFSLTEPVSEKDQQRILQGDLHVSGLLPGKQISEASGKSKSIEDSILSNYQTWLTAFERLNLSSSRRAYRMLVSDFTVEESVTEKSGICAKLCFSLSKGCYATSVIRELVDATDMAIRKNNDSANGKD